MPPHTVAATASAIMRFVTVPVSPIAARRMPFTAIAA